MRRITSAGRITIARRHVQGQRHPERVERGEGKLDLGEVWAMVFAVSELEESAGVDTRVSLGGGGIEAHRVGA